MIAPVTHILPMTHIHRSRMLTGKGQVLVQVGQKVIATDRIAETSLTGGHVLIDIRQALGLHSLSQAHRLIDRKPGERVEKGDILAQTGRLFTRVIRTPVDGQIIAIHHGQVLIEKKGAISSVLAGMNGVVSEVLPERGAIIDSYGALIQGVWGNHKVNSGQLFCAAYTGSEELTRSNLDFSLRGYIILAGYVSQADTLMAADEMPLRGLILGSMSADLIPVAMQVQYPILLTEGFGRISINSNALNILKKYDQRELSIDAFGDAFQRKPRPEIIIPLPGEGPTLPDSTEFIKGQTVRVNISPFAGQIGVLTNIRPGLTRIQNGLRIPAADITLVDNQVITLPLANLDALE